MLIPDYTFGVEIEFKGALLSDVATALTNAGIPARTRSYGDHSTASYWKLTTDATVTERGYDYQSGNGIGGELVSPILKGDNGLRKLETALMVLNKMDGVRVDVNCGLHVHLGKVDGWTAGHVKKIYRRYADHESVFDSFMPRSRRGGNNRYAGSLNGYTASVSSYNETGGLRGLRRHGGGKFMKVNLSTITRNGNGTIEFRQHAGTTDYLKISNWIRLLIAFADASKTVSSGAATGSHDYKAKRKSTAYAALREQVEMHGGSFKYAGGKNWKISGANGVERDWVSGELTDIYVASDSYDLDAGKFSTFWAMTFGADTIENDNIFKDVGNTVVTFFKTRIVHFATA